MYEQGDFYVDHEADLTPEWDTHEGWDGQPSEITPDAFTPVETSEE